MFYKKMLLGSVFAQFLFVIVASAQIESAITVSGEVITPLTLSVTDFKIFPQVSHRVKDRDGKEHVFSGVLLFDVLKKAGVSNDPQLRGENLAKYVLVQAADGYEVVFSLPEIDPEFTDQKILLATQKDGEPMETGEGPFRLIVPNDKKQARWIREIRTIKIRFVKE